MPSEIPQSEIKHIEEVFLNSFIHPLVGNDPKKKIKPGYTRKGTHVIKKIRTQPTKQRQKSKE